jgi:hypothetical protein
MDGVSLARTLGTIHDVAVAPDRWPALLDSRRGISTAISAV